MDSQNSEKKNSSIKVIIIIGIVVILALLGVIIYLILPKKEAEPERRSVVVTEENVEEVVEEMANAEPPNVAYYAVTMNSEWRFPDGKSKSTNAYVENIIDNETDVYFDLFLASDEENAIYESPVIPRGSYLENFALDKSLDAGTYDCVMIYHLIDEKQNTLSTLRVSVTIIIEG